jgi:3-oxoacyl-(acyl-carrier-protein) synthase
MREGYHHAIQPALLGAGCTSAAGDSIAQTWDGVVSGRSFAREVDPEGWTVAPRFLPRACLWGAPAKANTGAGSSRALLVEKTMIAYREAFAELSSSARARIHAGRTLGVILATTKGALDDEIWKSHGARLERDFFSPILEAVLRAAELTPARKTTVSNACASALSALALARGWLSDGEIEDVLVLAVDRIGPFVLHGFHSLRAVTREVPRPFGANRSGLLLGEASAALFLSRHPGPFQLSGIGVDAEGFAVTRPAENGASLRAACRQVGDFKRFPPDLVIAHGTGTEVNDPIEARVLSEFFPAAETPITASKGALGHTLATSGAIDLILARESIRRGLAFTISQTTTIDPKFTGNFLPSPTPDSVATIPGNYSRVLVTSLGFGGIHAAAMLERSPEEDSPETGERKKPGPSVETAEDTHAYRFPVSVAPGWAPRVERWYQLDASAFGMADAAQAWRGDPPPDVVFLASPGGSNVTDAEFAAAGARSPALFVHSLPNVRGSAFCQVFDWQGPIFCLQNDPDTFADATEEARRFTRHSGKSAWVLGIVAGDRPGTYTVRRFRIGVSLK